METTEHIDDLAEGYVLGALEQSERQQVEQHISSCPPCRQMLGTLGDAAHMLGFATVAAAPSIACKRKVLERIEREQFLSRPTRRSRMPAWAMTAWASVATVAFLVMSMVAMSSQQQVATAREELNAARLEADAIRDESGALRAQIADRGAVDDLLLNGAERELDGAGSLPSAKAVCLMKPGKQEAVLLASGLEPLPDGKVYQAWVAKGDEQAPLATFTSEDSSAPVQVWITPPKPMDHYDNIMVTVEDAPGAQQPSQDSTVLLGEL